MWNHLGKHFDLCRRVNIIHFLSDLEVTLGLPKSSRKSRRMQKKHASEVFALKVMTPFSNERFQCCQLLEDNLVGRFVFGSLMTH